MTVLVAPPVSWACENCDKPRPIPNFTEVRPKAEAGDPEAQVILASAYRDGLGVTIDDRMALQWFQKAAAQNFPSGQHGLGMMFTHGRGVEKDLHEGMKWCAKAANQGYPPAQLAIAGKFRQGQGTERDLIEAYKWYIVAARGTNRTVLLQQAAVATKMSKHDIVEAERRVAEFDRLRTTAADAARKP